MRLTTPSSATALLGFCDRVIRVEIPRASVHRRVWRKAVAEPKTIGEHLRRKRVDMGLTNVQVAQILGVCYQTVERWEHDRCPMTAHAQSEGCRLPWLRPGRWKAEAQHLMAMLGICRFPKIHPLSGCHLLYLSFARRKI